MTRFLRSLYYWLDLLGPQDHPAQSKVLVFLTQLVLLAVVPRLVPESGAPTAGFLWYVGLVLVAPYGLDGLKFFWKLKAGGLDAAVLEQEKQRPATVKASREPSIWTDDERGDGAG